MRPVEHADADAERRARSRATGSDFDRPVAPGRRDRRREADGAAHREVDAAAQHDDGLARRDQDQRHDLGDLEAEPLHRERSRAACTLDQADQQNQHDQRRASRRGARARATEDVGSCSRSRRRRLPPAIVALEDAVLGHRVAREHGRRPGRSTAPASGRPRWRARRGRSSRTGSRSRAPRGRASSRRSRPWCRHRRRGSGRRRAGSAPRSRAAWPARPSAGCRPTGCPTGCRCESALMCSLLASPRSTSAASARVIDEPAAHDARERGQHEVLADRLAQQQALRAAGPRAAAPCPISGDSAWRGLRIGTGLPQTSTWPSSAIGTEQRHEQLPLTVTLRGPPRPAPRPRGARSRRRAGGDRPSGRSTLQGDRVGGGRRALGEQPGEPPSEHHRHDVARR